MYWKFEMSFVFLVKKDIRKVLMFAATMSWSPKWVVEKGKKIAREAVTLDIEPIYKCPTLSLLDKYGAEIIILMWPHCHIGSVSMVVITREKD